MHEIVCDWPTKEQVREHHGRHVRVATTLNDLYFAWSKYQVPGYQPRHGGPPKNYSIVYSEEHGGFVMVLPTGMYQPVTVGPHTNYGQPCGGYGCNGMEPYCDDCEAVAYAHYEEERQAYYDAIGPLNVYPIDNGYDDLYVPGYFWPDE